MMKPALQLCLCLVGLVAGAGAGRAQGFSLTTPAFHGITVRTPTVWIDVMQFLNAGFADGALTTNYADFSGHGIGFRDRASGTEAGNTNFQFFTRLGGVLAGNGGITGCMFADLGGMTNVQRFVFSGWTNRGTVAFRIYHRAGQDYTSIVQTGWNGPTTKFALFQVLNGQWYFDWGSDAPYRIQKPMPVGATNAWINMFYVHEGTNSTIYVDGTNWFSQLVSAPLAVPPSGMFQVMGNNYSTQYLAKRIMLFDYALPPADVDRWNREFKRLP